MCNIGHGLHEVDRTVRKDSDTHTLIPLLKLFPTGTTPEEKTRQAFRKRAFIHVCYAYADAYRLDCLPLASRPENSGIRRRELHNAIMNVVQKLFMQPGAANLASIPVPDRTSVRAMILAHEKIYRH